MGWALPTISLPLTKSPDPAIGRIGARERQNSYRGYQHAVDVAPRIHGLKVAIITNSLVVGGESDSQTYQHANLSARVFATGIDFGPYHPPGKGVRELWPDGATQRLAEVRKRGSCAFTASSAESLVAYEEGEGQFGGASMPAGGDQERR
jgi:hypothetical protein